MPRKSSYLYRPGEREADEAAKKWSAKHLASMQHNANVAVAIFLLVMCLLMVGCLVMFLLLAHPTTIPQVIP